MCASSAPRTPKSGGAASQLSGDLAEGDGTHPGPGESSQRINTRCDRAALWANWVRYAVASTALLVMAADHRPDPATELCEAEATLTTFSRCYDDTKSLLPTATVDRGI